MFGYLRNHPAAVVTIPYPFCVRRLVLLAVIVAVLGGCTQATSTTATEPPIATVAGPTGPTGDVIGGIWPCVGISLTPVHFVSGTIVALRGSGTTKPVGPDEFQSILPRTVVARQTVGSRQKFHFSLPPGPYVLHVIRSRLASELPNLDVTIEANHTVHANMPDACK